MKVIKAQFHGRIPYDSLEYIERDCVNIDFLLYGLYSIYFYPKETIGPIDFYSYNISI